MQAEQLLHTITQQRLVMAQAREQYGAVLAPDFLVLDYLRTDEMGLSRIVADLLDPKGSHHQGNLFLRLFIPILPLPEYWADSLQYGQNFSMQKEALCHASRTQRRMDILLTWQNQKAETFALCIENKPYAKDQQEQVKAYLDELKRRNSSHFHVLYLSGNGSDPSEYSLPDAQEAAEHRLSGRLSTLGYAALGPWLKLCRMECRSERVAAFIKELEFFIDRRFMGVKDMDEAIKIQEVIKRDSQSLTSAFEVAKQIRNVQDQLIEQLQDQLDSIFNELGYQVEGKLSRDKWSTLRLKKDNGFNDNYHFAFSFDKSDYCSPIVGLVSNTEETINKEFGNKVFDILKGASFNCNTPKKTDMWAYCVPVGRHDAINAPYCWHWSEDPQPWVKILEGTMAQELSEHIFKLDTLLHQELPKNIASDLTASS